MSSPIKQLMRAEFNETPQLAPNQRRAEQGRPMEVESDVAHVDIARHIHGCLGHVGDCLKQHERESLGHRLAT